MFFKAPSEQNMLIMDLSLVFTSVQALFNSKLFYTFCSPLYSLINVDISIVHILDDPLYVQGFVLCSFMILSQSIK